MKMKSESWADGKEANCPEVTAADPTPSVRESNTQRDSKRETGISDDDIKTFETDNKRLLGQTNRSEIKHHAREKA